MLYAWNKKLEYFMKSLSVLQFELDCSSLSYFEFHDNAFIEIKFYSFNWADHQVPETRTDKLFFCPRIFNKNANRKKR